MLFAVDFDHQPHVFGYQAILVRSAAHDLGDPLICAKSTSGFLACLQHVVDKPLVGTAQEWRQLSRVDNRVEILSSSGSTETNL